jgi:uncharacterized membrane protein
MELANKEIGVSQKPGLLRRIARTFIAGLFAALPLVLTLAAILWLAQFAHRFLGPNSIFGNLLESVGLKFVTSELGAYLIGLGIILGLIYLLGILLEAGMRNRWNSFVDNLMDRVPLAGTIYGTSKTVLAMFDPKDQSEIKSMTPVMCTFGGEGGTAVLALMPSEEPVQINNQDYHAVLIPTAPVPFGGALLYVPVEWIKPADFSFEGLLNIYMSMGITSSNYMQAMPAKKG